MKRSVCALLLLLSPIRASASAPPVIAVFDIEDQRAKSKLPASELQQLSAYLSSRIGEGRTYHVVPRDQVRGALVSQKAGSYKTCFDQSCQIELGKALAAQKTLGTAIQQFGKSCMISANIYDLRTEVIEQSATERTKCDSESLLEALDKVVAKLKGGGTKEEPAVAVKEAPKVAESAMVFVPAGEFFMGCNEQNDTECEADEKPGRKVTVAAFSIDRTEVTVAAFARCVQAGVCSSSGLNDPKWDGKSQASFLGDCNWNVSGREEHPINCVEWLQADAYCRWVGKRLPTEQEWEKAARGTDGRKYPWGNETFAKTPVANIADEAVLRRYSTWEIVRGYDDGAAATAAVGRYPAGASPYGALDMIGNVTEWLADWYAEGQTRATRGESWTTRAKYARASDRGALDATARFPGAGFRCASTLKK